MTPKEMEARLLEMQERYRRDPRPELRAEYRRLHAEWLRAKAAA